MTFRLNGIIRTYVANLRWFVRTQRGRTRILLVEARDDASRVLKWIGMRKKPLALPGNTASAPLADPVENQALALAEFDTGSLRLKSTPPSMTLESTSWCNLRCVMCPQGINAVHRPKHMEPEVAQGLESFIRQARSIQLHGIGEPTASRAFWYNLSLLSSESHSEVNTNFTLLDERKITALVGSNLKVISVSLDAARPETYQKIRGFSFDKVIGNIRKFVAARSARGQRLPQLHMNMTLMRTNIEEVPAFIELAASLGADAVFVGHLNRWSERTMRRYIVDREQWTFDYSKEGLWNFPALSDEHLRKAMQLAREKNIPLIFDGNKQVFFEDGAISSA